MSQGSKYAHTLARTPLATTMTERRCPPLHRIRTRSRTRPNHNATQERQAHRPVAVALPSPSSRHQTTLAHLAHACPLAPLKRMQTWLHKLDAALLWQCLWAHAAPTKQRDYVDNPANSPCASVARTPRQLPRQRYVTAEHRQIPVNHATRAPCSSYRQVQPVSRTKGEVSPKAA